MATTSTIKRPYITPAIEECFDCETEVWLMDPSNDKITGSQTDTEQGDGDWDEDFSKQNNNSNFNIWDDDAEEY